MCSAAGLQVAGSARSGRQLASGRLRAASKEQETSASGAPGNDSLNNQWDRKKTNPGWELPSLWNLHSRPARPKADNLAPLNLDFWSTETETSRCVVLNRCICGHLLSCTAEWMQLWHALARNNLLGTSAVNRTHAYLFLPLQGSRQCLGLGWDVPTQILQKHSANIWSLDPSDARGWGLRSAARQLLRASAGQERNLQPPGRN